MGWNENCDYALLVKFILRVTIYEFTVLFEVLMNFPSLFQYNMRI